jgi:two-component system, LytTR family, sensor kinase
MCAVFFTTVNPGSDMVLRESVKTVCIWALVYAGFVFTKFAGGELTWTSLFTFGILVIGSAIMWAGSAFIFFKTGKHLPGRTFYAKLLATLSLQAIYLAASILFGGLLFQKAFYPNVTESVLLICFKYTLCFGLGFTFLCQIQLLRGQRQKDLLTVEELEKQLRESELELLKNELDPHFVYNTLVPLSYLIDHDAGKAKEFTQLLLQVYQFLLENKNKNYTTVAKELEFSKNYFFLLRVRFKEGISLSVVNKCRMDLQDLFVLPCSLQILLENAVKHNSFTEAQPLHIEVIIDEKTLTVRNNLSSTSEKVRSSGIGLKNLKARFRLVANSTVLFIVTQQYFAVRLPLRNNSDIYDKNSYHRRRFFNF